MGVHLDTPAQAVDYLRRERLRRRLPRLLVVREITGGFNDTTLWRWESGKCNPRLDAFLAWVQTLGCRIVIERNTP